MTGERGQFTCPRAVEPGDFPTETEQCTFDSPAEAEDCDALKDVTQLTMVWDGADGVNFQTELGQVITGVNNGDVVVFETPKDQTGNDVDVTITGAINGASRFHISCSDNEMDGPEDCGTRQGNGKDNNGSRINDWLLDGMTGENGAFDCGLPNAGVVNPQ